MNLIFKVKTNFAIFNKLGTNLWVKNLFDDIVVQNITTLV